jgi:hypothetical protein
MTTAPARPVATVLSCSQCGGTLEPAEGQVFLTCPFCSSTVYLDKRQVVFHWAVARTIAPEAATAALRRWMAGNATVKDLDRKAEIKTQEFQYFPLWYFRTGTAEAETIVLEPAAATTVSELRTLNLPPGDLHKYDPALDGEALMPDVTLAAAGERLAARGIGADRLRERALVHLPLYSCKYVYGGETYAAIVDGASGAVLAGVFPAKPEGPYLAIAAIGWLLTFIVSWIPAFAYWAGGAGGLAGGLLVYAVAVAVLAVPLFLAAGWISARV